MVPQVDGGSLVNAILVVNRLIYHFLVIMNLL
jgi:hypothetical protein